MSEMVSRTIELLPSAAEQGESFVIVVTYLPLKSFWNIISFFRMSNKVEAQLRASKGIIRYALRTDIPHKRFWTLSVWTNRDDMALFSRSEPHRTAMKKFYEWGTDEAGIAEWATTDGRLDWQEAEKRLETPIFRYKFADGKRLVHASGSRVISSTEEGEDHHSDDKSITG